MYASWLNEDAVFEWIAVHNCPIVICGDFNIHVDQTDDVYAVRFRQLLQSFGLVQHVNEPTHSAGHMLDLIITRTDTEVTDLHVGDMISDHDLRSCSRVVLYTTEEAKIRYSVDHQQSMASVVTRCICI